jgi:transcriptional regulator with GAF, ATPase, and Fis domain
LFYRLYVVPVRVPPLRERGDDIRLLAEYFRECCAKRWRRNFVGIEPEFLERLMRHAWPGNVRELEHVIERACLVSDGKWLDLPGEPSPESADGCGCAPPSPELTLIEVERQHIERILASTGYRVAGEKGAAKVLGLHPNTLRHRLAKLGIQRPA